MYILLYVKLIWCSNMPYIYGQLEGGILLHICYILLSVKFIWCSVIGLIGGGTSALEYMCILLYLKVIWCSGIP